MNVLVTGATGFLGKALCEALAGRGDLVTGLSSRNCDLRDCQSLARYSGQRFERIYHLAAWTQAGDFCLHHPGEQWIINQQINTNVLSFWQQHQPQAKMIAIGTSCSYDVNLPLREENYLLGQPIASLYTYAMAKRMLHVGLLALAKQFGLRYLHVIPSTLYGPDYHEDGRQMHFIFDLIRKILAGKLHNEPVVLWGDGYQERELVYRDDFVRCLLELAERVENDTVNIGTGKQYSIRAFAEMICGMVGYPFANIQFDTSRHVGARSKCLCPDKLQRILPGIEWTPLEEGLAGTIAWMRRRPEFMATRV